MPLRWFHWTSERVQTLHLKTYQPSRPPCNSIVYTLSSAKLIWSLQTSNYFYICSSVFICPPLSPSLRRFLLSTCYGQHIGTTYRRKMQHLKQAASLQLKFHLLATPPPDPFHHDFPEHIFLVLWLLSLKLFNLVFCLLHIDGSCFLRKIVWSWVWYWKTFVPVSTTHLAFCWAYTRYLRSTYWAELNWSQQILCHKQSYVATCFPDSSLHNSHAARVKLNWTQFALKSKKERADIKLTHLQFFIPPAQENPPPFYAFLPPPDVSKNLITIFWILPVTYHPLTQRTYHLKY